MIRSGALERFRAVAAAAPGRSWAVVVLTAAITGALKLYQQHELPKALRGAP